MKKATPFGEMEVYDAHAHFFSRRFFGALISQSPTLGKEKDPIARAGELTGWMMPPDNPVELSGVWRAELDKFDVAVAVLIASVPNDEESVVAAVAAHPAARGVIARLSVSV